MRAGELGGFAADELGRVRSGAAAAGIGIRRGGLWGEGEFSCLIRCSSWVLLPSDGPLISIGAPPVLNSVFAGLISVFYRQKCSGASDRAESTGLCHLLHPCGAPRFSFFFFCLLSSDAIALSGFVVFGRNQKTFRPKKSAPSGSKVRISASQFLH